MNTLLFNNVSMNQTIASAIIPVLYIRDFSIQVSFNGFLVSTTSSLWSNTVIPMVADFQSDTRPLELGVKWVSTAPGSVVALRFYKGTGNTGVHQGNLWDATGNNLATVTYMDETDSGWQQQSLPTPVAITPGKTYVSSYFMSNGNYSRDVNYFASQYNNSPLYAPSDSASGGNGVWVTNNTSSFPTQSFSGTNFYSDVVLQYSAPGGPNGVFTLRVSNDAAHEFPPTNWCTLEGFTHEARGAGGFIWPVVPIGYNFIQLVYTDNSNGYASSSMTARFNGR